MASPDKREPMKDNAFFLNQERQIVEGIIAEFGNTALLARAAGITWPSVVQYWKVAGRIPAWRRAEVAAAAHKSDGVKLTKQQWEYLADDTKS